MTDHNKNFSQNIHHLRRVHGLTQAQMAEILGVSVQTLSRIEKNGTARINSQMLCRVCDYFGLSTDAILRESWAALPGCGPADPSA